MFLLNILAKEININILTQFSQIGYMELRVNSGNIKSLTALRNIETGNPFCIRDVETQWHGTARVNNITIIKCSVKLTHSIFS